MDGKNGLTRTIGVRDEVGVTNHAVKHCRNVGEDEGYCAQR